jgi:phospholipid/cholesterol/gamma-HCH transport system substrate-binding protein
METRANHVLIGVFALVVILAGFGFVIWLSNLKFNHEVKTYDIVFSGSVTGVGPGGDVRYNGLKYGEVKSITLLPRDPSKVLVRIELDSSVPVTTDTKAVMQSLSVTGISVINLLGTKPGGTPLVAKDGQPYPTIYADAQSLQDIFKGLPELVANANSTLDKLNGFLDDDNRLKVKSILANTDTFTASLAHSGAKLDALLTNADTTARNLDQLVKQTSEMVQATSKAVAEFEGIATDNRAAIADFARNGLGEISRFATEARALVRTLDRVADHLDADPQSIIYGPAQPTETKLK